jgi:sulfur-oxidizing protein SoxY
MLDTNRRVFLKESLATSAVSAAWAVGLLNPQALLAEWSKNIFEAKDVPEVLKGLYGTDIHEANEAVEIKAPEIAENGAVVPITIESNLPGVTQIAVFASINTFPLAADFRFTDNAVPYISTRIKMSKTGDVVAVVKAGDKLYSSRKEIKVTIGGCGG